MPKAPHTVEIIVNGRSFPVDKDDITFEEVVALAFDPPPTGDNICLTVTYRRAQGNKSGTLLPGESVKTKAGMIFDVTATDKS